MHARTICPCCTMDAVRGNGCRLRPHQFVDSASISDKFQINSCNYMIDQGVLFSTVYLSLLLHNKKNMGMINVQMNSRKIKLFNESFFA